ncbi:MAG: TfoX/Sxy family protein [Anaeromyxobacter sp.]
MSNAPSFVDFALDLLTGLGPVQARPMFGGHGLYARGVMFGLLDDDELFLKTDDLCRARFTDAGCRMWVFPGAASTPYYRPPDDAHEDAEAMLPWARAALEAALRKRDEKAKKAAAAAARKAERERTGAAKAAAKTRKPAGTSRSTRAKRPGKPTGATKAGKPASPRRLRSR